MKKNVGSTDKVVRLVLGVILGIMGILYIETTLGIIGLIVGIVLILTALVGRCALYYPLGISTCKTEAEKE